FKVLLNKFEHKGDYEIVGHSCGAMVGIHMCRKAVPIKTLIVLDPMDAFNYKEEFDRNDKVELVLSYLGNFMPLYLVDKLRKEVLKFRTEAECCQRIIDTIKSVGGKSINGKDMEDIIKQSFDRADMVLRYQEKNIRKLKKWSKYGRELGQ